MKYVQMQKGIDQETVTPTASASNPGLTVTKNGKMNYHYRKQQLYQTAVLLILSLNLAPLHKMYQQDFLLRCLSKPNQSYSENLHYLF